MNCEDIQKELSAFISNDIEDAARSEIKSHLNACQDCSRVYREIKRGHLLGAPTDSPVIQGRIAVDQLVRILENRPFMKQVGPRIQVIDRGNINTFDRATSLAPGGFRTTYSVNVQLRTE